MPSRSCRAFSVKAPFNTPHIRAMIRIVWAWLAMRRLAQVEACTTKDFLARGIWPERIAFALCWCGKRDFVWYLAIFLMDLSIVVRRISSQERDDVRQAGHSSQLWTRGSGEGGEGESVKEEIEHVVWQVSVEHFKDEDSNFAGTRSYCSYASIDHDQGKKKNPKALGVAGCKAGHNPLPWLSVMCSKSLISWAFIHNHSWKDPSISKSIRGLLILVQRFSVHIPPPPPSPQIGLVSGVVP